MWEHQPGPRRRRKSCEICSSFPPSHLSPPRCFPSLPETFHPKLGFSPGFSLVILWPLELCGVREGEGSYVLLWASPRLLSSPPLPLPPPHLPSSSPLRHSPPSSPTHRPLGCSFPAPPGLLNVSMSLMKGLPFYEKLQDESREYFDKNLIRCERRYLRRLLPLLLPFIAAKTQF